jgi:hypothetical protein
VTAGIVVAALAGILAGCDVPAPFDTVTKSPGAEAGQTPGVDSAGGTTIADRIGVAPGATILWASDAEVTQTLDAIANTGVHWITLDIDWNSIQSGGPNSWWWEATDRVVLQARARGLKIIGVVAYSPTWARPANCPAGSDKCLPSTPESYANLAQAVAARYGTTSTNPALRNSITVWQVWNEANHYPFVQPTVDVAYYTNILKRAYVSFKAGDPASTVLAGGTAPAPDDNVTQHDVSPVTFLRGIYANGGQGFFDAFSHHPYSFPCNPLVNANWNAFTQTQYLHDLMVQNGDGNKKIWGTESGAPTASNTGGCAAGPNVSVTEAQQAQWVSDYSTGWNQNFGSFTGPLIWYQIRDAGTNPTYFDDHFGLLRRDFSQKPAYDALRRLVVGG